VIGWWSLAPLPTDPEEVIWQPANWLIGAYVCGLAGPTARVDLECKVGGSPSSNVGVDHRSQLDRSSQERD
jgi:hypothetical protein